MPHDRIKLIVPLIGLIIAIASAWSPGQSRNRPASGGDRQKAKAWKFDPLSTKYIDRTLEWTAKSVSRRYDLDQAQARVAKTMMVDGTMEFVSTYRDDLQFLLVEMYEARLSGQDPTADKVKQWANRAQPVFDAARKLITDRNIQFHQLLNDEQKKIHRRDLDEMRTNFGQMAQRLNRWQAGDYKPGEFGQGLSASAQQRKARRLGRKRKSEEVDRQLGLTVVSPEYWELYVKLFIDAFELDKGQQTLAYSVLAEIKARGVANRMDNSKRIDKLQATVEQLSKLSAPTPNQQDTLAKAKATLNDLYKPQLELFEELQRRLMAIPTAQQRQNASQLLGVPSTQKSQMGKATTTNASRRTRSSKVEKSGKVELVK